MKIYKITEASEYLGVSINTLKTLANKDAVAFAALRGEGATVRWGHSWVLWTEGKESFGADESYDNAASVMIERLNARQRHARNEAYGGCNAR